VEPGKRELRHAGDCSRSIFQNAVWGTGSHSLGRRGTNVMMPNTKNSDAPPRTTLEALGRVVLGFNELDLVITTQVEVYMGCESEELANLFIRDLRFGDKVDRLKALLRVHADRTGLGRSRLVSALNATLGEVKECANKRNQLVHGIVRFDATTKCFVSTLKGKEYVLRTRALNELAESMLRVSVKLVLLCLRFTEALGAAYKERGTSEFFANP